MRFPSLSLLPSVALAALTLAAGPLQGQDTPGARRISLEEALRLASGQSEQVEIARAGVLRAEGDVLRARAARLPQLGASASYQRTLASQFEGVGGGAPDSVVIPPRCQLEPDPGLPIEQRVEILEGRLDCPFDLFSGGGFSDLGFGAENTYNLGLSLSWPVYTGGRLPAQQRIARAGREVAEIGLTSAQAQLRLDVTQAYYNALLADQLVEITEATLRQAEETLRLAELGARVGQQAEFDVLRARVARDNQLPLLIQRQSDRDLAYDRLHLFLELPLGEALVLTSRLDQVPADPVAADTSRVRAPVEQAARQVVVQEAQVRIAESQRLPNLSLSSQYGQVAFANGVPGLDQFRDNWNVVAAVQVPLFTGGRIRGDVLAAEAGLVQAEEQLQQARELATLDTRGALAQLRAARATFGASRGTVEQAERAYGIAELRYREGLSNLLELNDTRLLLQQARTNAASAAANLQVAQTRVELLPYLPISASSGIGPNANAGIPNGAGTSRAAETQGRENTPTITTQPGVGATPTGPGAP